MRMVSESRAKNSEAVRMATGTFLAFLPQLLGKKVAFGLLRKPGENDACLALAAENEVIRLHADIHLLSALPDAGFLAFPFDRSRQAGVFIPARLRPEDVPTLPDAPETSSETGLTATSHSTYTALVQEAVAAIRKGEFTKLVLSRHRDQLFPPALLPAFLTFLIERYPQAYVSVFSLPGKGLWVSASPELLLQQDASNGLRTMALAGTKAYEPGFDADSLWSPKELEEQSLVSGFVRDLFRASGLSDVSENGPYPVQAGHLVHLRTDFQHSDTQSSSFFTVLDGLHPTPAVCGTPQGKALAWIREKEDFDRRFFTGFSGWMESGQKTLVVNLRTACISHGKIRLYAGAGITRHSDPEKEWLETETKLETLGRFFAG